MGSLVNQAQLGQMVQLGGLVPQAPTDPLGHADPKGELVQLDPLVVQDPLGERVPLDQLGHLDPEGGPEHPVVLADQAPLEPQESPAGVGALGLQELLGLMVRGVVWEPRAPRDSEVAQGPRASQDPLLWV